MVEVVKGDEYNDIHNLILRSHGTFAAKMSRRFVPESRLFSRSKIKSRKRILIKRNITVVRRVNFLCILL